MGRAVDVIVLIDNVAHHIQPINPLIGLSREERIAKIRTVIGSWKNNPEIAEIFAEIDQKRHTFRGRSLATFDK